MNNDTNIIIRPMIGEKATRFIESDRKYVFQVDKRANKIDIKRAVQNKFDVEVLKVAVMNYKGTDQLTCANRKVATTVSTAAVAALADFKNPYLTTEKAIVAQAAPSDCALAANEGNTMLSDTGGTTNLVTIATCDVLAGTLLSDTVQIE